MKLLGPKLLARKYTKPEKIGSIYTNPAWRRDNSRSLWEVVETSPAADKLLKISLLPDWILVTPPNSGVFLWRDETEDEVFLLAASSVRRIIPWTTDKTMKMHSKLVLVEPDAPKTSYGTILAPETAIKRPVTGVVEEVGPEVADLAVGDRVLYTVFSGTQIELNGRKKMILDETQVLATVGEGEEVA